MPYPHSLCGAGLAEVAQTVRLPGRRIHLALRRCSQRPSIDRLALDFRQFSFRHVTRVSPSTGFSVFSPLSALPAGSCPLTLSSLGKPLTQGSPLNPSHLRWGCCMNYCGAPDAGGSQVQLHLRPYTRAWGPRETVPDTCAPPLKLCPLLSGLALRSTTAVRRVPHWGGPLLHGSATAAPLTPSPGR